MIPHSGYAHALSWQRVRDVEVALGLEPHATLDAYMAPIWDRIAHECNLPDTEQLKRGIEGPGIDTLPHWLWNRAVDIANKRSA